MNQETSFSPPARESFGAEPQLTNLQKAELLRGVDLFSMASVEELFRLASIARELQFAAHEIIVRENDMANALYVVVQGRVELSSHNDSWKEVVDTGQAFGLHALLTREAFTFTAKALRDTFTVVVGAEDFFNLLSNDPEILSSLFNHFVKRCAISR